MYWELKFNVLIHVCDVIGEWCQARLTELFQPFLKNFSTQNNFIPNNYFLMKLFFTDSVAVPVIHNSLWNASFSKACGGYGRAKLLVQLPPKASDTSVYYRGTAAWLQPRDVEIRMFSLFAQGCSIWCTLLPPSFSCSNLVCNWQVHWALGQILFQAADGKNAKISFVTWNSLCDEKCHQLLSSSAFIWNLLYDIEEEVTGSKKLIVKNDKSQRVHQSLQSFISEWHT